MKKNYRKLRLVFGIATAAAITYAATASALLFVPRVSSEEGLAALKDQKQKADQLSEQMWITHSQYHISSPKERPVTKEYLTGINRLAAGAANARATFFEHEQKFVWPRVLDDIQDMREKLGGFGSTDPTDAENRIKELNDAYLLVAENEEKSIDTLNQTKTLLTTERRTLYTDMQLIRTLLEAAKNEHLLVHDSGRIPFADIARLQDAHWAVFELHQQMLRDYHDSNRVATAVRVALGR